MPGPRRYSSKPVGYPGAGNPQAWAAAATPHMFTSLLSLRPDGFGPRLAGLRRPVIGFSTKLVRAGLDVRPVKASDVSSFPLDDGLILFDARNNESYVLNATGALVWGLIDGTRSVADVAREFADVYGLAEQQGQSDVQELLDGLFEANVLSLG